MKRVILKRKNSLFFKPENGAHVGDVFLSLIHTCQLAGENPLDYLSHLLRQPHEAPPARVKKMALRTLAERTRST